MKALEKDRTRRYETANGFAADIQRYLNDEPVEACPPSAGYRFRKFARRNKVALAVVSVAVAGPGCRGDRSRCARLPGSGIWPAAMPIWRRANQVALTSAIAAEEAATKARDIGRARARDQADRRSAGSRAAAGAGRGELRPGPIGRRRVPEPGDQE